MLNFFKKATFVLSKEYHNKLYTISILTLLSSVIELAGIGMIIPILSIFVDADYLKYTNDLVFLDGKTKEEVFVFILL